jgi:hypothetical protein
MKCNVLPVLVVMLSGCSGRIEEPKEVSGVDGVTDTVVAGGQTAHSVQVAGDEGVNELVKKWTWGDTIHRAVKSSISRANFPHELLLRSWAQSEDINGGVAFTVGMDSLDIPGEGRYIYTVAHDSLRVFTSYDHPGDGFTRGIITRLTKDSLVIEWSTGDSNGYVPVPSAR